MIEILTGAAITMISLLLGYSLGKHDAPLPPDTQKRLNTILKRAVPPLKPDVGIVERPDVKANFYRDNPRIAKEHETMSTEFDKLQSK